MRLLRFCQETGVAVSQSLLKYAVMAGGKPRSFQATQPPIIKERYPSRENAGIAKRRFYFKNDVVFCSFFTDTNNGVPSPYTQTASVAKMLKA